MKPPVYDPEWDDEVQALYRHDLQELWDPGLSPQVWNQYHNQLDVYREIAGPAHGGAAKLILDVGCAQGTLALLLAEQGHRVVAVDLRESFLEYAKTRHTRGDIRFVAANVLELELVERFDLIFANQIVEHLVYPEVLVRRLKRLLLPGGRLVVTTPNWHYLMIRLPSFLELGNPAQFADRQFTADADGHFFAYRADELRAVFHGEGLVDVAVRYFETPFISGHLKLRYLHRLVPGRVLRLADRLALSLPPLLHRLWAHQLLVTGRAP